MSREILRMDAANRPATQRSARVAFGVARVLPFAAPSALPRTLARYSTLALPLLAAALAILPGRPVQASDLSSMQPVDGFSIDRTEVTVGQFRRFVEATGTVTSAERDGGGQVYDAGWTRMPGWTWRTPYGLPAGDDEPAVHLSFDEAAAYCHWAGKRLPTDDEWLRAAYTEHRQSPPAPFVRGRSYPFPTGDSPAGANCLGDCGPVDPIAHGASLSRGAGHARAGSTRAGVNGLYDMGANVWEWVDQGDASAKRTRGGSWWYGAEQMRARHEASKPPGFAAVYIGFRCARDGG